MKRTDVVIAIVLGVLAAFAWQLWQGHRSFAEQLASMNGAGHLAPDASVVQQH